MNVLFDLVRGYEAASLGPRDINGDVLGGNRRFIANLETLFPMPGIKDKSVRLSTFVDAGYVWGVEQKLSFSDLRASVGRQTRGGASAPVMIALSTHPPRTPARSPGAAPATPPTITAAKPTVSETREPQTSRDSTSRPR